MLFVDPKTTDGNVIAYDFAAVSGESYMFSLWVANAVNFTSNPNGKASSLSFIINGPGVVDKVLASIDLAKDNVWKELSSVWSPTTSGTYTLTIRAKGDDNLPQRSAR